MMTKFKFALLGKNTNNSYSKIIHHTLFSCDYDLINIDNVDELHKWIKQNSQKFHGFNVTSPYKVSIIDYLDCLDYKSQYFGSVNCVKNINGKLHGYNTDGDGFIMQLNKQDIKIHNKKIAALGTSGVSRSIVGSLINKSAKICLYGRSSHKLNWFKNRFSNIDIDHINKFKDSNFDIVINTTPLAYELPVIEDNKSIAIDLTYNPAQSPFLIHAEKCGYKIYNGFYMLVYQAILSQKIWRI